MNRKLKIGLVGILLLAIMIPAAISVSNGEGTGSSNGASAQQSQGSSNGVVVAITPSAQQSQAANAIAIKAVADTSKNTVVIANSPNPLSGYGNGLYLWTCCMDSYYSSQSNTILIGDKVEVWDSNRNNVVGSTVYNSISYWNGNQYVTYQWENLNTGHEGDEARILWSLPQGRSWYSFIEGYYYDINGGFHYVYQTKYFNT